jgi:hypothetical protein
MDDDLREDTFKIIVHLVSSSVTSLPETPTLASYRMIDGADRLIRMLSERGAADEFLTWAHEEFVANVPLAMSDQAAFLTWLDGYARAFARESVARHTG